VGGALFGYFVVFPFGFRFFLGFANENIQALPSVRQYFGFAIITTIENIGIQFLMTNFIGTPLELSMLVALSIGYFTKFLLDRKYVFNKTY